MELATRCRRFRMTIAAAPIPAALSAIATVAYSEPFPGSYEFYLHAGDVTCNFSAPQCYSVQAAELYFVLHPEACTDVVAEVFVDDTYVGSTGMLDGCESSPHYDITSFLSDGSAQVSLRNPRCSPGYGCCGAADSSVATWAGYVYLQGTMTPTGVEGSNLEPSGNRLEIHPNPPAGVLWYSITLASPSRVTVELFDAAGRRVGTLLDRALADGRHSYSFAPSRPADRPVPAGVYLLRMRAGEYQETQKVVIVDK